MITKDVMIGDQTYTVTLDKEPASDAELRSMVEANLRGEEAHSPTVRESYRRVFSEPLTKIVAAGLAAPGEWALRGLEKLGVASPDLTGQGWEAGKQSAEPFARFLVPQTPTEAGVLAGTLAAGPLAAPLRGAMAVGTRIGSAIAGGTVGGATEGHPVAGAIQGAIAGTLGEGISAGIGKLARSLPGAKRAINQTDADVVAEEIGKYLPGLREAKSPADLKKFALSLGGKKNHETLFSNRMDHVADLIGGEDRLVSLPSLMGDTPTTFAMALRRIREIGHSAFAGKADIPIQRTLTGAERRHTWQVAKRELEDAILRLNPTGEALALFRTANRDYAVGSSLFSMLRQPGAFTGLHDTVLLNLNHLRSQFERRLSKFENVLEPAELAQLTDVLYRGGKFGTRDILAAGEERVLDAVRGVIRGKGGSGGAGVWELVTVPLKSILPGIADQYVGKAPPLSLGVLPRMGIGGLAGQGVGNMLGEVIGQTTQE